MNPKKICALLVGINEYHPKGGVPALGGTHKDVNDVKLFFEQNYNEYEKEIVVLHDEEATREALIYNFEQHLANAEEGDVALFYYSGHGSYATTNDAFLKFDPDGRDEGLVCYDSRVDGKYDLADKEMAVLLKYVAAKGGEVVLLMDSCHSGSTTRETVKVRMAPEYKTPRPIDTYLEESTIPLNRAFYQKQLEQHNDIVDIPESRHILMAACSESELARETDEGGWFTQSLLNVLRETEVPLSYFQTYRAVYSIIAQKDEKQTPQLEGYGMFNANHTFLTGEKNDNKEKRFQVTPVRDTDAYRIDFSAQAGFPLDLSRAINFNIYEGKDDEKPIGTGTIETLGITDSRIDLYWDEPSDNTTFWAELLDVAFTPLTICFEGDNEELEVLNRLLDERDIEQVILIENDKVCPFILAWQEKERCYRLYERDRGVFILELDKDDFKNDRKISILINTLEHLAQWHYTVNLDYVRTEIDKEDIEVRFHAFNAADNSKITCEYDDWGEMVQVSLEEGNEGINYHKVIVDCNGDRPVGFDLSITNNSYDAYYVACLQIDADYGVKTIRSNIKLEGGHSSILASARGSCEPSVGVAGCCQLCMSSISCVIPSVVLRLMRCGLSVMFVTSTMSFCSWCVVTIRATIMPCVAASLRAPSITNGALLSLPFFTTFAGITYLAPGGTKIVWSATMR